MTPSPGHSWLDYWLILLASPQTPAELPDLEHLIRVRVRPGDCCLRQEIRDSDYGFPGLALSGPADSQATISRYLRLLAPSPLQVVLTSPHWTPQDAGFMIG
jgi:hypothetical protein